MGKGSEHRRTSVPAEGVAATTDTSSNTNHDRAAAEGIALVNALKNAGADHDLQLPRIVFAGKQSAGKSSLVEAVTGIALPRASGTCTKCPIEVTTEQAEGQDWECKVTLRLMYDGNHVSLFVFVPFLLFLYYLKRTRSPFLCFTRHRRRWILRKLKMSAQSSSVRRLPCPRKSPKHRIKS